MSRFPRFIIITFALTTLIFIGCSKDSSNPVAPTPDPVSDFSWTGSTVTPASITFQNRSTNADTYSWDFGDGRTSVQENPSMAFSTMGTFTVTLKATASSTGKFNTTHKQLTITPGKVYLNTVYVDAMPFTDANGAGWDLTSGPDLYFDLLDASNTIIYTSSANPYTDLTPQDLPVHWTWNVPGAQITDWSGTFKFALYDYDAGSADDLIGTTTFRINTLIGSGYLASYTLTNSSIRMHITVTWQ